MDTYDNRGLRTSVSTQNADFGTEVHAKADVLQQLLPVGRILRHLAHGQDDLTCLLGIGAPARTRYRS